MLGNRGLRGMFRWERRERWIDIGCGVVLVSLTLILLFVFLRGIL